MKYIAIFLLVVLGVYLYKRAKRLAEDEQEVTRLADKDMFDTPPVEGGIGSKTAAVEEPSIDLLPVETNANQAESDESWVNAQLAQALIEYRATSDSTIRYQAMLAAVAECYKQRKNTEYSTYGAGLTAEYLTLFASLGTAVNTKGVGFMHLSTLLSDVGMFDEAIEVCQKAISYGLSDGTVTGFEGRMNRIAKAKGKLSQ